MNMSGKDIKADILDTIRNSEILANKKLLVISVGNNGSAMSYLKGIESTAKKLDVEIEHVNFSEDITNEVYASHLDYYNNSDCSGMLLLTPLPNHLDLNYLGNKIDPSKDVDCLNEINTGKFYLSNDTSTVGPCTAKAVMKFLSFNDYNLQGKKVCVVGASNIVGKPLAKLLLDEDATVTVCNAHTTDLKSHTLVADVVVSCAGVAKLITADMINSNSVVIDVGINFVDGKICGDVDYENCIQVSSNISSVPGGVGTVTSTMIYENMMNLNKK